MSYLVHVAILRDIIISPLNGPLEVNASYQYTASIEPPSKRPGVYDAGMFLFVRWVTIRTALGMPGTVLENCRY